MRGLRCSNLTTIYDVGEVMCCLFGLPGCERLSVCLGGRKGWHVLEELTPIDGSRQEPQRRGLRRLFRGAAGESGGERRWHGGGRRLFEGFG